MAKKSGASSVRRKHAKPGRKAKKRKSAKRVSKRRKMTKKASKLAAVKLKHFAAILTLTRDAVTSVVVQAVSIVSGYPSEEISGGYVLTEAPLNISENGLNKLAQRLRRIVLSVNPDGAFPAGETHVASLTVSGLIKSVIKHCQGVA